MGRFYVLFQGIILCLCFTTGCATLNVGNPFSSYKDSKESEDSPKTKKKIRNIFARKADKKSDKKEDEKAVAKKEDGKSEDSKTAETKDKKEEIKVAEKSAEDKKDNVASSKSDIQLVKHDAKTIVLIEEELKNHPPAERKKVYNELKALDSHVVEAVINIWQMTRQAEEQSPSHQNASQRDGTTPQPKVQQPPQNIQIGKQTSGLGSASPWQKKTNVVPAQNQYQNQYQNQNLNQNVQIGNTTMVPNQIQPAHPNQAFGQNPQMQQQLLQNQFQTNQQNPLQQNPLLGLVNQQLNSQMAPNSNVPFTNQVYRQNIPAGAGSVPNMNSNQQQIPMNQQPVAMNQLPGQQNQKLLNSPNKPPQIPGQYPNSTRMPQKFGQSQVSLMPSQYSVPEYRTRAGMTQNSQWGNSLQNLIAQAESEVSNIQVGQTEMEESYYIERQVYLRLLYLMAGQQNRALEVIPGINSKDQEFWTQVLWGLANYFDIENMPDKSNRATQTITQLRTAIQGLQGYANLELRNVNFCNKIENFGNYKKYDRDEFRRGQSVLVYVEVKNLEHQFVDNKYRSEIHSSIEIFKAGRTSGLVASPINFPPTEDASNDIRNDFFLSYQLTIPEDLTLGPHTMKLKVEDKLGNKMQTYSLNFIVK